jgi:hypothetical protein
MQHSDGEEAGRRRRRVRHLPEAGVGLAADTSEIDDQPPEPVAAAEPDGFSERSLRGLVGGGSSQVKPTAAMRARDAARPRAHDIATAETELVIVRRNWTPRD